MVMFQIYHVHVCKYGNSVYMIGSTRTQKLKSYSQVHMTHWQNTFSVNVCSLGDVLLRWKGLEEYMIHFTKGSAP